MTQTNLGNTLLEQALRSGAGEAVRLLEASVAAFDGAFEVFTPEHHPHYAELVGRNKERAAALLDQARRGEWPPE